MTAVGITALAAAFWLALAAPIPTTGNEELAHVVSEVKDRFPGWHITHATAAWENAYTVVAQCGGKEIGFQFVPEHGLPVGAAWVQPNDEFTRARLAQVSDHQTYLVWFEHPLQSRQLSCHAEMARELRAHGSQTPWTLE